MLKTIGIIGGLGPEASAQFYMEVVKKSLAKNVSRLASIILYNIPITIEDDDALQRDISRSTSILLPYMIEAIRTLERGGADILCMPCNTAHAGFDVYRSLTRLPFISIIDASISRIQMKPSAVVAILGTVVTVESGLYTNPLKKAKISYIVPDSHTLYQVLDIIKRVLMDPCAPHEREKKELFQIVQMLCAMGANTILLGCTELPLLVKQQDYPGTTIIDTIEALGDAVVEAASNSVY